MSPENPPASEPLVLDVEELPRRHPAINAQLLLEHARVALASHGASPSPIDIHWRGQTLPARVHFQQPDPRSALTLQRPTFVELGAVVLAGLVLPATSGLQLTRVTPRGSRVDYFVGHQPGDLGGILEVGGTDRGSLAEVRGEKQAQLRESPYLRPPFCLPGYVSVTRFARPAASSLDEVPIGTEEERHG
jgi:hypothetical protein